MTEHERSYCVVALEPVQHEGLQLGHVRRVFYRRDDLPSDLDVLWMEQGHWRDDERWASDTARGRLFFELCKGELFGMGEAIAVACWVRKEFASLRDVTVQLIDDESLEGEVPVRMVTSPFGTVSHWNLESWSDQLGLPVSAFAEFGHGLREGRLCPIGWYGWACGGDLNNLEGRFEHVRTRPLGTVAWS